jgi:hypothetical protein
MQSLQPGAKPAPGTVPGTVPAPFFNPGAPLSSSGLNPGLSSGPSEFTRIIQGSEARSSAAPVATFAPAPQAGGGPAVGLPIAAPQMPKAEPPPAPRTKLQSMLPWLLAINGILVLLLIVLAVLFLRRH